MELFLIAFYLVVMALKLVGRLAKSGAQRRTDGLPGREADDRLYATPPARDGPATAGVPLGLTCHGRPMFRAKDGGTLRAGVTLRSAQLPSFRLRRVELGGWRGEGSRAVAPGIVACARRDHRADVDALLPRLDGALPEVARLLPTGAPRWIEVSSQAVVVVTCERLGEAECIAAAKALDRLAQALLGEPAADPVVWTPRYAESRGPTRCAYCHDALEVEPSRCPACATALHPECVTELRRCPTAGCEPRREAA